MRRSIRRWSLLTTGVCAFFALTSGMAAQETAPVSNLVLILDASGSMWGQIEGENKIVIARRVLGELIDDLPDDSRVALVAYGHRREGDCADIETVAPLGPLDREALEATVEGLNPKGKTPITASIEEALTIVEGAEAGTTVILVSDGLETCGGDPCATVRAGRERGLELVFHVVGFDVAGEDVSQLECAAQAGGGLFSSAEDADQLSAALETAVAMPAEIPAGRLVVEAVAGGELQDVAIRVIRAGDGQEIAVSRTYSSPDTNPRSIPLPDGRYDVTVRAVGLKGDVERHFEIAIEEGSAVEKKVDYSTGEISIGVTRNGELSDAVYKVYVAGTREEVASGRTYAKASSNPKTLKITAGRYEIEVGSVELSDRPTAKLGSVELPPGGREELQHAFENGTLTIGAMRGSELADAVVNVYRGGEEVARARTYKKANSNPKSFTLSPGEYRVVAKEIGGEERELSVTLTAGGTVEETVDFAG